MEETNVWPLEILEMSTGNVYGVQVLTIKKSERLDLYVTLPGTDQKFCRSNSNPALAVTEFLADIENLGWALLCHRSRTDVVLSGFANGLSCYVTEGRNVVNPKTDLVSSFSPADPKFLPLPLQSTTRSNDSKRGIVGRSWEKVAGSRSNNQLGSEKLLEEYRQEIWLERGANNKPVAGQVYQSEFLGGRCIFGLVNEVSADHQVTFLVYSFMVDKRNIVPNKLFTEENIVETPYVLEAKNWEQGYFKHVGLDPTCTALDSESKVKKEPISIGKFGRSVVELLKVTPWFSI